MSRGLHLKARAKPPRFVEGKDHSLLALVAKAFALLLQLGEFGGDHSGATQQVEGALWAS